MDAVATDTVFSNESHRPFSRSNTATSQNSFASTFEPELAELGSVSNGEVPAGVEEDRGAAAAAAAATTVMASPSSKTLVHISSPSEVKKSNRITFKDPETTAPPPANPPPPPLPSASSFTRRSYDLQQALRLDDLEVKIEGLQRTLRDRDRSLQAQQEQIKQLENQLVEQRAHNAALSGRGGGGGMEHPPMARLDELDMQQRMDQKEKEMLSKELQETKRQLQETLTELSLSQESGRESAAFSDSASLKLYNPNNPVTLKKKIADLENQLLDQQEAFQSLLNHSADSVMHPHPHAHHHHHQQQDYRRLEEVELENKQLRAEVEKLQQQHHNLDRFPPSRELDHLKAVVLDLQRENGNLQSEIEQLRDQLTRREEINEYSRSIHLYHQERTRVLDEVHKLRRELHSFDLDNQKVASPLRTLSGSSTTTEIPYNHKFSTISHSRSFANLAESRNHSAKLMEASSSSTDAIPPQSQRKSKKFKSKFALDHARKRLSPFARSSSSHNLAKVFIDRGFDEGDLTSELLEDATSDMSSSADTASILSHAEKEIKDIRRIHSKEAAENRSAQPAVSAFMKDNTNRRNATKTKATLSSLKCATRKSSQMPQTTKPCLDPFSTAGRTPFAPRKAADVSTGDLVKFSRDGGKISKGLVRFVGTLHGRRDIYLGIELDHEEGRHDGVFEGRRYFDCKRNKGVFVAFNKIIMCYGFGSP